jgi:AcrR family transcriptional regulator|tara:strand:- start:5211 stop:5834 length:624 start_codon:yes stop_codon:yes gene_type:complete
MRRTKEDAQKTYDAILDAAVGHFSQRGVANTSLEDIAESANVTRGAIYWHFKNKGEIFDSIHERFYQPLSALLLEDIEKGDNAPLLQLHNICVKLLLDFTTDQKKRQAAALFMLGCHYSGDLEQYWDKHRKKKEDSLKIFSRYFEKAKQDGNLPASASPEILTLSIRCYMKGIITEYLNDIEGFDLENNAEKLIKQFFNSFLGKAAV